MTKLSKSSFSLVRLSVLVVLSVSILAVSSPSLGREDLSLLKKIIISYNLDLQKEGISDDAYRGEEGILMISPEVGRSMGLKVLIDQDYMEAVKLFKKADSLLEQAIDAMESQKKGMTTGEHAEKVAELAVSYNKALRSAKKHMLEYRARLSPDLDNRLDHDICMGLLEKLLGEGMETASYNLRDALAYFYNRCQGEEDDSPPLNPLNVRFVNHVFREFVSNAPKESQEMFDLDRYNSDRRGKVDSEWKRIVGKPGSRYVPLLAQVIKNHENSGYFVDPLLFLALIRQESTFDPRRVSDVGAAGLTQIMPRTAKDLGMKNIFMPGYFDEAQSLMKCERRSRRKAIAIIKKITAESARSSAQQAWLLMQKSLDCGRKWNRLYYKYKEELLRRGDDDRLEPSKAIRQGFKYFASMMKLENGDISLALASYNAGHGRVRQYKGIPPYPETISFRNRVLKFYRDYLARIKR